MNWPKTKDGDLLRRLYRDGINLSSPQKLEFNVDFNHWPPAMEILELLETKYGNVKLHEPGNYDELQEGYVSIRTQSIVSYEFITQTQREISEDVSNFGGYCDSWALLPQQAET